MFGSAVSEFADLNAFGASFRQADVKLTVIETGAFRAEQIRVSLPATELLICRETLPAIAHISLWPHIACVAFPTRDGEPAIADGARVVMGDVMYWPPGSRFHARTPARAAFACVLFNAQKWPWRNRDVEHEPALLPNGCRVSKPHRQGSRRLLRLCLRAKEVAHDRPDLLRDEGIAGELALVLAEAVTTCLAAENQLAERRSWRRHSDIMNRLEDILGDKSGRDISASEVCDAAGVAPRTMGTCCREHLGMELNQYLDLRRLKQSHGQVRAADPMGPMVN